MSLYLQPPPTYEETLRQSMIISSEDLQSVEARPSDLPLSTSTSSLEHTVTVARSPYHPIQSPTQEPLSV